MSSSSPTPLLLSSTLVSFFALEVSARAFLPAFPGWGITKRASLFWAKVRLSLIYILPSSCSVGPIYTRAAVMGPMFSAANSAGIISSNVYPSHMAPQGHGVAVRFALMAVVCAVVINLATHNENVRRDAWYGPVAVNGSDANPNKVLTPDQCRRWGLEGLLKTEILWTYDQVFSHGSQRPMN